MYINHSGIGEDVFDEGIIVVQQGFNWLEVVPNLTYCTQLRNSHLFPHQLEYYAGEGGGLGLILVLFGVDLNVDLLAELQDLAAATGGRSASVALHHPVVSGTRLLRFATEGEGDSGEESLFEMSPVGLDKQLMH